MERWTKEDDDKLLAMRSRGKSSAEIAHALNRTTSAVNTRVCKLFADAKPEASPVPPPSASTEARGPDSSSSPRTPASESVSPFDFPTVQGTSSERLARTLEALIQGVATGRLVASRSGSVLELTDRYLRVLELNLEALRVSSGAGRG